MTASTTLILSKSRMRKRACTDLCGGRSVMVVPTATVEGDAAVPRRALPRTSKCEARANCRRAAPHLDGVAGWMRFAALRELIRAASRIHTSQRDAVVSIGISIPAELNPATVWDHPKRRLL